MSDDHPTNVPEGSGDTDETDADELTHTTDDGDVQMVDVGDKPDTSRRAVAAGEIRLQPSTLEAISGTTLGFHEPEWEVVDFEGTSPIPPGEFLAIDRWNRWWEKAREGLPR